MEMIGPVNRGARYAQTAPRDKKTSNGAVGCCFGVAVRPTAAASDPYTWSSLQEHAKNITSIQHITVILTLRFEFIGNIDIFDVNIQDQIHFLDESLIVPLQKNQSANLCDHHVIKSMWNSLFYTFFILKNDLILAYDVDSLKEYSDKEEYPDEN